MNYELVTEICLVAGIGFALLAGVLFFAFEVPALVKGMRRRAGDGKPRDAVRELQVPGEAYAGAEETMRLGGDETAAGDSQAAYEMTVWLEEKNGGQADDVKAGPLEYGDAELGRRDET
jgi:hypothetical protein